MGFVLITARRAGREKVVGGETHLLKESARVARIGANGAFLFGNAKFACRKHKCHGALDADHAEKSQRNVKTLYTEIVGNVASAVTANVLGNLIAGAAATAEFVLFFNKLYGKADGRRDLDDHLGHIRFVIAGDISYAAAKIVAILFGGKDADVALTSEKYAFFVIHRNAAKFLAFAAGNASLEVQLEIKAHVNRIVSLVEGDGVYRYVGPEHFGTFATDVCCPVDYILTAFGEKHLEIFKAILVFYRIVYFVTVNTGAAGGVVFSAGGLVKACRAAHRRVVAERRTVLF